MNIVRHFLAAASQYPSNVAIVHNSKVVSYSELKKEVLKAVDALRTKGVESNDNVMVMIPFSIELYIHILAIFMLGANVVLVDQIKPKSRVVYAFGKANCKAIITTRKLVFLKYVLFHWSLWRKVIALKRTVIGNLNAAEKNADDSALITFTSGTTGHPKAADRTHGFLDIQLATLIDEMKIKPSDTHITSLPVVLMCNLAVGATSIIPSAYSKKAHWEFIKTQHAPSLLSASPAHFSSMSELIDCSQLSHAFIGGATILPHFAKEVVNKMEAKKGTLVYGSMEAEPMNTVSLGEYLRSIHSKEKGVLVGFPHPNIQLKINKKDSKKLDELRENELGEIIVSGRHVLHKYYQDEAAFGKNKIVANGIIWHRTGDAGYLKNGSLYYLGRIKHTWQQNGEWLSPLTLEKYLSESEVSIEGTWLRIGDKNIVFIQKKAGTDALLASFGYAIDRIIYVKELPRDKRHLSRVDYEQLVGMVTSK
jgi:acyl-coenzyme A synthetase/AMP-(fatty) acid ligase